MERQTGLEKYQLSLSPSERWRGAGCQTGMSQQAAEPEVVLGHKECGHTDVSQRLLL